MLCNGAAKCATGFVWVPSIEDVRVAPHGSIVAWQLPARGQHGRSSPFRVQRFADD